MSYATSGNPFGWPSKDRFESHILFAVDINVPIGGTNTWTPAAGSEFIVPKGTWFEPYDGNFQQTSTVGASRSFFMYLGVAGEVPSGYSSPLVARGYIGATVATGQFWLSRTRTITSDGTVVHKFYGAIDAASGTESWVIRGQQGATVVRLIPAGL